jgi:peptidyl-prolyl cis-trans isomerase A (cyclophilin A)
VLQLDREKAPKTVDNFLQYVRAGHYDGTDLPPRHRQLHDPGRRLQGRPERKAHARADPAGKPQRPEQPARHAGDGAHECARLGHRAVLHQRRRQRLPRPAQRSRDGNGYAVFGKVVDGMDVVDKIRAVPTQAVGMHQNLPVKPVILRKATVEK